MEEDLKILADYCYTKDSRIKLTQIWYSEIRELIYKQKIKQIYEICENETSTVWYYVVTTHNMRYIVKHQLNNALTKMMMKSLMQDKFECMRVNINSLSNYLVRQRLLFLRKSIGIIKF